MLEAGKTYKNNDGVSVSIGGRIRDYSLTEPFVWSICGDWYDESTGAFVSCRLATPIEGDAMAGRFKIVRVLLPVDNFRSISDHEGRHES